MHYGSVYRAFPNQPHAEMSMMTPSGPRHLTLTWLGRWPLPDWLRRPAAAKDVSLVAPAASILAAHARTMWVLPPLPTSAIPHTSL